MTGWLSVTALGWLVLGFLVVVVVGECIDLLTGSKR